MRTLSTSTRLGFAHFGAQTGVGKGQRIKPRVSASQIFAFG
jgi:hypothetical protein